MSENQGKNSDSSSGGGKKSGGRRNSRRRYFRRNKSGQDKSQQKSSDGESDSSDGKSSSSGGRASRRTSTRRVSSRRSSSRRSSSRRSSRRSSLRDSSSRGESSQDSTSGEGNRRPSSRRRRRSSSRSSNSSGRGRGGGSPRQERSEHRRRRRRSRDKLVDERAAPSIMDDIEQEYVNPESVYIYTHIVRSPDSASSYEFRADPFPSTGRRIEDYNIDLSGITGRLILNEGDDDESKLTLIGPIKGEVYEDRVDTRFIDFGVEGEDDEEGVIAIADNKTESSNGYNPNSDS